MKCKDKVKTSKKNDDLVFLNLDIYPNEYLVNIYI